MFCFLNFPQQKPKKVIEKDTKSAEFLGFKLKKAETVKRQVEQDELETVNLKHHEFEMQPMEEQVFVFFFRKKNLSNSLFQNLNFSNIFLL